MEMFLTKSRARTEGISKTVLVVQGSLSLSGVDLQGWFCILGGYRGGDNRPEAYLQYLNF